MEDKYNQLSIAQYSKDLAKLLCDQHFTQEETVNGPQLIAFTPVKQVNLFIIKELLLQWNREMANLRSPYFDFENPEVKDALVQFMNVLSRKILIKRPHFEPLLVKAIQDTFRLVTDTVTVFDEKFLQIQAELNPAKLQDNLKYIDIDKQLFQDFIAGLNGPELNRETVLNKFKLYLNAHYQDRTQLPAIIEPFNGLLPVKEADLLNQKPAPAAPVSSPTPTPAPEPVKAPEPVAQAPQPATTAAAAAPAPAPVSAPATTTRQDGSLNERFKTEEKRSLNESFQRPAAPTILQNQSQQKITSLKESISINQRFSFINELFNGENMVYHGVIQKLDEFDNADAAKNYLLNEIGEQQNWVKKEEHLNKLLRLIDRKFS